jgi:hypothetical protein
MKNQVLDKIGLMDTTKEKGAVCADKIQSFISMLTPKQCEAFWEVENVLMEYDVHIQDEIFKRLL